LITIANADAALKDYYLDAFNAQMNEGVSPFFSAIEKTTSNVYGKDVKLAIIKGNMGSIVAGDEDGDLPSPYSNRYYSVTLPLKNIYGTIEISDKAMRASRDNSGAFVDLMNAEMEGLVKSARVNFERMLFGDGNGYLFDVVSNETKRKVCVEGVKADMIGVKFDIRKDGEKLVEDVTIIEVNVQDSTIIVDKDVTASMCGEDCKAYVSGAYGKEICGLQGIFDGEELYGYDKDTYSYFRPAKYYCESKNLTETKLVGYINQMLGEYDSNINMIICSYKVRQQIAEFLSNSRRVVNTTDISAGFSSVVVNDIPVYADKFCSDDRIYLLNTDDFSLNQLCDWEWLEDEDGKILKQVAGKAAYSATLVKYAELICKKPYGQGVVELD
jgi:hypothetical protein